MTWRKSQGLTDSKFFAAEARFPPIRFQPRRGSRFSIFASAAAEGVSVGLDGKIGQRLVVKFGQQGDLRKKEFIKARNVEWRR